MNEEEYRRYNREWEFAGVKTTIVWITCMILLAIGFNPAIILIIFTVLSWDFYSSIERNAKNRKLVKYN